LLYAIDKENQRKIFGYEKPLDDLLIKLCYSSPMTPLSNQFTTTLIDDSVMQ
jgi:hypothetical protein